MKSIIISIKPKYVKEILNGNKTLEIRKYAPKCELPCEVYIYCTKGRETLAINPYGGYSLIPNKYHNEYFSGKVVAKFVLNKVEEIERYTSEDFGVTDHYFEEYGTEDLEEKELLKLSCLQKIEMSSYLNFDKYGRLRGYAWHIHNLKIFDRPKELKDFKHWVSYRSCEKCPYGDSEITPLCKTCREKVPLTNAPQSYMFCEVDE